MKGLLHLLSHIFGFVKRQLRVKMYSFYTCVLQLLFQTAYLFLLWNFVILAFVIYNFAKTITLSVLLQNNTTCSYLKKVSLASYFDLEINLQNREVNDVLNVHVQSAIPTQQNPFHVAGQATRNSKTLSQYGVVMTSFPVVA